MTDKVFCPSCQTYVAPENAQIIEKSWKDASLPKKRTSKVIKCKRCIAKIAEHRRLVNQVKEMLEKRK